MAAKKKAAPEEDDHDKVGELPVRDDGHVDVEPTIDEIHERRIRKARMRRLHQPDEPPDSASPP